MGGNPMTKENVIIEFYHSFLFPRDGSLVAHPKVPGAATI
jgi:hypothetical protein